MRSPPSIPGRRSRQQPATWKRSRSLFHCQGKRPPFRWAVQRGRRQGRGRGRWESRRWWWRGEQGRRRKRGSPRGSETALLGGSMLGPREMPGSVACWATVPG
ncbi:hypothetical protein K456DRAFT_1682101 [Colletotrichum gloeosporioides 23]|nr:hypothetical protein K456DRAFT_1682101 [Colletotrichum gloeosporioides 23]